MAKDKETAGGTCLFSGEPTKTKRAKFLPGYDAKFKALLLSVMRGHESANKIPKRALPFLESDTGICGFRMKGGKLMVVGNFKVAEPKAKKEKAAKPAAKATAKTAAPARKAAPKIRRAAPAPAADAATE